MSSADPFAVPRGWRRSRRDDGILANRPGSPSTRLEWRTDAAATYDALVVEDDDSFELSGHPVDYRRFGHRDGGVELVSEEWTWHVGGHRHTLTGTVPRDDYLSVCDLFEDVAATVDFDAVPDRGPG